MSIAGKYFRREIALEWQQTVVLVHGLWFPKHFLYPLARRLRHQGFIARYFSYPSVRADLHVNAGRLAYFLDIQSADTLHLVGHSLGGILIRALFHLYPSQRPGRIVTLGSPHGGCQVAQHLYHHALWRRAMGRSVAQWLAGHTLDWPLPQREIGVISGSHSFGLGRVWYRHLPRPNDGLLTVTESGLPGAADYITLPVSHTGMLFSPVVAYQAGEFLKTGHFVHGTE
jgi:pimeloyl-ACP methyl ester carboxylesterase